MKAYIDLEGIVLMKVGTASYYILFDDNVFNVVSSESTGLMYCGIRSEYTKTIHVASSFGLTLIESFRDFFPDTEIEYDYNHILGDVDLAFLSKLYGSSEV